MEKVKRTPASLKKLVETFNMEIIHKGSDYDTAVITVCDAFRPSLQLVGFFDYFDDKRLQVLGKSEMQYLARMDVAERTRVLNRLMSYEFPAMIVSRNLEVFNELVEMAKKHGRTLLRTEMDTVEFTTMMVY
jgi:HPr kinase/phosphorylase